jgi:radical SAM superfamily enzyme YgiQ (UPF0313 family)
LDLAQIPLESRRRERKYPLVIAGGVAVFLNPEPLSEFFDLFILGEAEEVVREFLEVYRNAFSKERRKSCPEVFLTTFIFPALPFLHQENKRFQNMGRGRE